LAGVTAMRGQTYAAIVPDRGEGRGAYGCNAWIGVPTKVKRFFPIFSHYLRYIFNRMATELVL